MCYLRFMFICEQEQVWRRKFTRGAIVQPGFLLDGTKWPELIISYASNMECKKKKSLILSSQWKRQVNRGKIDGRQQWKGLNFPDSQWSGTLHYLMAVGHLYRPLHFSSPSSYSFFSLLFRFKRGDGWVYKRIWPWIDFCFALSVASWLCQLQGAPSWRLWLF